MAEKVGPAMGETGLRDVGRHQCPPVAVLFDKMVAQGTRRRHHACEHGQRAARPARQELQPVGFGDAIEAGAIGEEFLPQKLGRHLHDGVGRDELALPFGEREDEFAARVGGAQFDFVFLQPEQRAHRRDEFFRLDGFGQIGIRAALETGGPVLCGDEGSRDLQHQRAGKTLLDDGADFQSADVRQFHVEHDERGTVVLHAGEALHACRRLHHLEATALQGARLGVADGRFVVDVEDQPVGAVHG